MRMFLLRKGRLSIGLVILFLSGLLLGLLFPHVQRNLMEKRIFPHENAPCSESNLAMKIEFQGPNFSSNSRPRVYLFIFPMMLQSGEWVKVSGVIIPKVRDVKVKLTYISPRGEIIVRYASTSGGGRFADLFHPKNVGKWKVMASWEGSSSTYVNSEVLKFTVKRPTLLFYGLLASLVFLISVAMYLSFLLFI